MQIEREHVLKAESQQRTRDRHGYVNDFKPEPLKTRVGEVELRIPRPRGCRDKSSRPFYPKALDRGVRSEWAMILAMAEMYVQGGHAVVEEFCGLEVTLTQPNAPWKSIDVEGYPTVVSATDYTRLMRSRRLARE